MASDFSRREMLKRAAVVGTATAVPAQALAQVAGSSEPYENLTADEARTLESVVARLIPSDENGPGALEAGAARYIDRSLSNALATYLDTYRDGLAAIDAHARDTAGSEFAALDPEQQDRILEEIERNADTFFNLVLNHTIEGTFCDPKYGGNDDFIGWELIGYPGIRLAVGPSDQQMAAQLELNRISAADMPMFDNDDEGGNDDR